MSLRREIWETGGEAIRDGDGFARTVGAACSRTISMAYPASRGRHPFVVGAFVTFPPVLLVRTREDLARQGLPVLGWVPLRGDLGGADLQAVRHRYE